jgi:hypothetical protein
MPVLVVHRELAASALREAGFEPIGFVDPTAELEAIKAGCRLRVLVTRVVFGHGKLSSVARTFAGRGGED